jgi:hypothetical protein
MGKESRRAPRTPHDSVLELHDENGRLMEGTLKLFDVSASGASFSTTKKFAKGARIRGRMRLLGKGAVEITGRIVRFKERENSTLYAVEFDAIEAPPR